MKQERSSGILLHITSLPSAYGIGDLGPSAYQFVDFLRSSGHTWWQLLPLNPTGGEYSHSPYSTFSAFAGNPLMISPELLEADGLLDLGELKMPEGFSDIKVKFEQVEIFKKNILEDSFEKFRDQKIFKEAYEEFCEEQKKWLHDFALFQAFRKRYPGQDWSSWPEGIRERNTKFLKQAASTMTEDIEKEKFIQFIFFKQWRQLKEYAHANNVRLLGDIPFYVNHHSADCWANPSIFKLNEQKQPAKLSGVPPDLFSETGQLWGTPVYDWKNLKASSYKWWTDRLKQNLRLFDLVRLDHFRAFSGFWEVGEGEKTAIHGRWIKAPGQDFFRHVKKEIPDMPFIAEDLGSLDEDVYILLQKFSFRKMKVLQFAFGGKEGVNTYLPFNHSPGDVVYTGTHDNNTCKGWFKRTSLREKQSLELYTGLKVTEKNVHTVMHELALKSVGWLSVIPLQDILGLGEEAIMNVPAGEGEHWTWRIPSSDIPMDLTEELREKNIFFGRYR